MSSVAIIATGQYLLGNTLAAATTVATAATLTNPIAMTCAALGAIYYGWNALTDKERAQLLEKLSSGLAMGVELIRSLVDFAIRKSKDLMTSNQLVDAKGYVKTQAALFGRSLYDITRKIGDAVKGSVARAGELLEQAGEASSSAARDAYESTTEASGKVATAIKRKIRRDSVHNVPIHGFVTGIDVGAGTLDSDLSAAPSKKTRTKAKSKR
jgi:hypothetical protein